MSASWNRSGEEQPNNSRVRWAVWNCAQKDSRHKDNKHRCKRVLHVPRLYQLCQHAFACTRYGQMADLRHFRVEKELLRSELRLKHSILCSCSLLVQVCEDTAEIASSLFSYCSCKTKLFWRNFTNPSLSPWSKPPGVDCDNVLIRNRPIMDESLGAMLNIFVACRYSRPIVFLHSLSLVAAKKANLEPIYERAPVNHNWSLTQNLPLACST